MERGRRLWSQLGTAVVELASACGLTTIGRLDPFGAHTGPLGQVIAAALDTALARAAAHLSTEFSDVSPGLTWSEQQ
jgi:hypothetical protein